MKTHARSVAVPRPNSSVSQGNCGIRLGAVGFELDVADRPVEEALGPLQVVQGVAARPEADVPQPHGLLQGVAVETGELHAVQVLDLRQVGQRLRQRGEHRIELPVGRRLLRADPLVEPVDDLPEHLRLGPGRQQGVELIGLRRFGLLLRIEPLEDLLEGVGRVELFEPIEVVDRVGEQFVAVLARRRGAAAGRPVG